jgi:abequosyltransferase
MHPEPTCKLSICISTFNRAKHLGMTLDSLLPQVTGDCEVVVVDGASSDDTEQVVREYTRRWPCLRYFRQNVNGGLDKDFDLSVELARGEYCWLMGDDDQFKDGALSTVLRALEQEFSMIIVNSEQKDITVGTVIEPRVLKMESNRIFAVEEFDELFSTVGGYFTFTISVVIKRTIWMTRDRRRYYGSMFIHAGVIFQEPLPGRTLVIAEPLICASDGNCHTFAPNMFEVSMFKWPEVVWSLAPSRTAKKKVTEEEPWKQMASLLTCRVLRGYSPDHYRKFLRPRLTSSMGRISSMTIAFLPVSVAYPLFVLYCLAARKTALLTIISHARNWPGHCQS